MELTWAGREGREGRPRWPRDSQIISFHPLRGQASIRLTRNSPTPSPPPPPPLPPPPTDRDGSPTKNNLESRYRRGFFQRGRSSQRFARKRFGAKFSFSLFSLFSFFFSFFFFFFPPRGRAVDGFLEIGGGFESCAYHTVTRRELKDD